MANSKPSSYRVGRILKKLLGFDFADSFFKKNVSEEGLKQSKEYIAEHGPISLIHPNGAKRRNDLPQGKYIQYQKELVAKKHLETSYQPKPPGKIPKLPVRNLLETDVED